MNKSLKRVAAAAVLALAIPAAAAAGAGAAHAAADPSYTQAGSYQFASDTYDFNGTTGSYVVTGSPQAHSDSSQVLGADGVDLTATPGTAGYADSGVIVPLGPLSGLFGSTGTYVGPEVKGSANLGVNFYFGTNGSSTSFGTLNSSDVLTGANGDNYASVGVGGTAADFTTFASYAGSDTAFTGLTGSVSMADVKAAYAAAFGTEGVKTADPEVWAWIGISGATAQTGYVTSVNGSDLVSTATTVTPPAAAQPVVLSGGHVVAGTLLPNRSEVAWTAKPTAAAYKVTIVGPNFPGGRTNVVHVTAAFYEGLAARHTYAVYVTPLNADGTQAGATGHVTFVTK